MTEKVLITSALLYANGPLHFGHLAGAYLPGDCYARFERLQGKDVAYICGSDEYGIAITLSAEVAGRSPQEHVDLYHALNMRLFEQLNFSFDHFSRTTWEGHAEPVDRFFLDLLEAGYIEERVTDQLYSEEQSRWLADRYVVGQCPACGYDPARGDECPSCGASYEATDVKNPRSKLTGGPLVHKATKHWFLRLDLFKDRLLDWLDTKEWKPNVLNFVKGYVEKLHARGITRDLNWGVPVPLPNTEGKVLYVWFDAPIGYISATQEWSRQKGEPDLWKKYWLDKETKLVHFIGKDNLAFHAVIFPSMIMGQSQPYKLVDELPANEFLNLEGKQFSKSDGWYVDLEDFLTRYSSDQIRYTLAANAPETSDSEFTWKDFQQRCNGDLVGKFGNLVHRVLVFTNSRNEGKVPAIGELETVDREYLQQVQALADTAVEAYSAFRLRHASRTIMELAQLGNVYFDAKKPWKDAKSQETQARMATTLACCLEGLKAMALVASPIIPEAAQKIWEMLGQSDSLSELNWHEVLKRELPKGAPLPLPKHLFQEIPEEQIEEERAKLEKLSVHAKSKTENYSFSPLKESVSFEDFSKLDLRVGVITACEPVPKSKKLLKLQVDIGLETRQVVAGIKKNYSPETLVGKKVVVVANLQPAKLMGVESQGMILAANDTDELELLGVNDLRPGSIVK